MLSSNLWSNRRKSFCRLNKHFGCHLKSWSNIFYLGSQKWMYHTLEKSGENSTNQKFDRKVKDTAKQSNQLHNSSLVPIKLISRNSFSKNDYNLFHKFVNLARFVIISKLPNLNLSINRFLTQITKENLSKDDKNNSEFNKSLHLSNVSKNCKCDKAIHSVQFSSGRKEPLKSKEPSDHGRYNYHQDVECAVNQQILAELNASYAYLSMACYFGRTDVALPGCQGFFLRMHEEEHQHALKLIEYQNMRGGSVKLCSISAAEVQDWCCITNALEVSLELEKLIKEKLTSLHDIAEKHHDLAIMDMITADFIHEQDRSICEFGRLVTRSRKMSGGCGCTEFLFDREMHIAFVKKCKSDDKVYV